MKELSQDIIDFLQRQGFVIVSTLDYKGGIHCSAKGIVEIEKEGRVYLVDLYRGNTFRNIKRNPTISITAIDERQFIGYTLKGKAKIVKGKIKEETIKKWEKRIVQRILKRVIRSVKENKISLYQPEARLPSPQYLIQMEIEEIVNLSPSHLLKRF
jgi:uncharacterized pyridoxamine 5'-phosphate oxidase family protein